MSIPGSSSHTVYGRTNSSSLQSNNLFETPNSVQVQSIPFQPNIATPADIPPYLQQPRLHPDGPMASLPSVSMPDRYNTLPPSTVTLPNPITMHSNGGAMQLNTMPTPSVVQPDAGMTRPNTSPSSIPRHMMEHGERRASSLPPTTEEHPSNETYPPQTKKTASLPVDKSKHIPNNFFDRDDVKIMQKKGEYTRCTCSIMSRTDVYDTHINVICSFIIMYKCMCS